jgi:exosortase/archaeosortase family protein
VPTDIIPSATRAHSFVLRFAAWSLGLFGLLRLPWVESYGIVPLTRLQGRLASPLTTASPLPIDVTLACSGTDVLALCVGAILAYPTRWQSRLAGAGAGIVLVLLLNTLRIGTLGATAGSTFWFETLHLYVWPAILMLAVAGYVYSWMHVADTVTEPFSFVAGSPARRFLWLTAVLVVIFTAAAPLYLESASVLAAASMIARAAAVTLRFLGIHSAAAGNVLLTPRGAFRVTQECVSTPLIPVYLAAVFVFVTTWRRRVPALLAVVPLFAGLGVARLLVIALPAAVVASPIFLVHAFYQLVLAAAVVLIAALWRHGACATAWGRAALGLTLGGLCTYVLAPVYGSALARAAASGAVIDDPQGAIAILPAFQLGLYIALSLTTFAVVKWRPFAAGLALLGVSQIAVFAALALIARHPGITIHVRDIRAWALAGPLLAVIAVMSYERPNR